MRMTLREAADRTSRSITTLRRYIRGGRLHAEKRNGRYGPEYFVSESALIDAGLFPEGTALPKPVSTAGGETLPATLSASASVVPLQLFNELQMKHEQLLVQYGMVRAAGMRMLELQSDLDDRRKELESAEETTARLREQFAREAAILGKKLRQTELELEGKRIEVATLKEKIRELEMLARNRVTNESVDQQYATVMAQAKRVEYLRGSRADGADNSPRWPRVPVPDETDH